MTSYHQQILAQMWGDQNTVADTSDASSVVVDQLALNAGSAPDPVYAEGDIIPGWTCDGPTAEEWAANPSADWWWGDIDPATKRRLADLCVYHEQTPALDQVTALALAMQSGEEAEIIVALCRGMGGKIVARVQNKNTNGRLVTTATDLGNGAIDVEIILVERST